MILSAFRLSRACFKKLTPGSSQKATPLAKQYHDWEKTSLGPYIEYFRAFVLALAKDERDVNVKRERDESSADLMNF